MAIKTSRFPEMQTLPGSFFFFLPHDQLAGGKCAHGSRIGLIGGNETGKERWRGEATLDTRLEL